MLVFIISMLKEITIMCVTVKNKLNFNCLLKNDQINFCVGGHITVDWLMISVILFILSTISYGLYGFSIGCS